MEKTAEDIAGKLKELIDEKGPGYLADYPYEVFKELTESGRADRKTAGSILYCLVSGIGDRPVQGLDRQGFTDRLLSACSLNQEMADRLSGIFALLWSEENLSSWEQKAGRGLSDFLGEDLEVNWKGYAVWDTGGGSVDCHYEADIILSPGEKAGEDEEIRGLLLKNPFIQKDDLQKLFRERLTDYLDGEFDSYCNADDYYQPCVEDFFLEDCIERWCRKNGFEVISCEGSGYDDDFQSDFRGKWY